MTVEVRARIPAALRDQLERLADRNFRSMAGEVAAACSTWVQQHSKAANAIPLLFAGAALFAAAPATAQSCGVLGSPYGIGGCVAPSSGDGPSYRIKADPINRGQFRVTPIQPSAAPSIVPPGLRAPSPYVPGLRAPGY